MSKLLSIRTTKRIQNRAKPYLAHSATEENLKKLRSQFLCPDLKEGAKFSSSPFRAQAEKRKDREKQEQSEESQEENKKRRFDPLQALSCCQSAFENITGRQKKKKKTTDSSKPPVKKAPAVKLEMYHIALCGNMMDLVNDELQKLSIHAWKNIQELKRQREIQISPDASHYNICSAIHQAFDNVLPEADPNSMRFCLLQVKIVGKGKVSMLKPPNVQNLGVRELHLATISARPRELSKTLYPNFFFITLPEGSEDLETLIAQPKSKESSFKEKSYIKLKLFVEVTYSEDDNNEDQNEEGVKSESDSDLPQFALQPTWQDPFLVLIAVIGLERHAQYSCYLDIAESLKYWFMHLEEGGYSCLVVDEILRLLEFRVLGSAKVLVKLSAQLPSWTKGQQDPFEETFSLGPGGIDLIVTCLQELYVHIDNADIAFQKYLGDTSNLLLYKSLLQFPSASFQKGDFSQKMGP
ncbi:hypothetical protein C8R42DRAFT_648368 [Lentinula raphanica]|nr:hypothetical protein C8R42DRAFT_648368 [Lentinula raphanica]